MAEHNDYGDWAEERASSYLVRKGYAVLERNWRFDRAEVDIIAKWNNWIIAVEVKARKSDDFLAPELFVDERKQGLLIKAMNRYIDKIEGFPETRFDIITIVGNKEQYSLKHIEHAFE
jgi:putative endonuclease